MTRLRNLLFRKGEDTDELTWIGHLADGCIQSIAGLLVAAVLGLIVAGVVRLVQILSRVL